MRSREEILLLPPVDLSNYGPEQDCSYYTASKKCALGRVYSDASLIKPSWISISRSPWGEAAKVCGGYGRRLVNGTTSRDAPDFIYSKARNSCVVSALSIVHVEVQAPWMRR